MRIREGRGRGRNEMVSKGWEGEEGDGVGSVVSSGECFVVNLVSF